MQSSTSSLAFPQLLATAVANLAVAMFTMGFCRLQQLAPVNAVPRRSRHRRFPEGPGQLPQKQLRASIAHCDCEAAVATSLAVMLEVAIPCSCGLVGSPFSSFASDSKLPDRSARQLLTTALAAHPCSPPSAKTIQPCLSPTFQNDSFKRYVF